MPDRLDPQRNAGGAGDRRLLRAGDAVGPRLPVDATLTDLLRGGIVLGIFAVAALLVLISGGIDVSFTAVAAFTMYVDRDGPERRCALDAVVGGAGLRPWRSGPALGAINGVLIAGSRPAHADRHAGHPVDLPRLHADLHRAEADHHPAAGDARVRADDGDPGDQRRRLVLFAARGLCRDGGWWWC